MSIDAPKNPKKGRPRVDSEAIHVRLGRGTLTAIDDWRRLQTDLPPRTEAIRRLIELGLLVAENNVKPSREGLNDSLV